MRGRCEGWLIVERAQKRAERATRLHHLRVSVTRCPARVLATAQTAAVPSSKRARVRARARRCQCWTSPVQAAVQVPRARAPVAGWRTPIRIVMRSRCVQPIGPLARTCAPLRAWVAWSSIVLSAMPACAAGAIQRASAPASATTRATVTTMIDGESRRMMWCFGLPPWAGWGCVLRAERSARAADLATLLGEPHAEAVEGHAAREDQRVHQGVLPVDVVGVLVADDDRLDREHDRPCERVQPEAELPRREQKPERARERDREDELHVSSSSGLGSARPRARRPRCCAERRSRTRRRGAPCPCSGGP